MTSEQLLHRWSQQNQKLPSTDITPLEIIIGNNSKSTVLIETQQNNIGGTQILYQEAPSHQTATYPHSLNDTKYNSCRSLFAYHNITLDDLHIPHNLSVMAEDLKMAKLANCQ